MTRRVKGILFVDYVRLVRSRPEAARSPHLEPEDRSFLDQDIDLAGWYPMAVFERLGLAILETIPAADLERVRDWGRQSVERVIAGVEGLVVAGDPRESLMRFQVFRRTFFDFDALSMLEVNDASAEAQIDYGMSPTAEEAAAVQTQGFFEGLVELAGGSIADSSFLTTTWRGDPRTVLRLEWRLGEPTPAARTPP
jgi:hypothetical protein